MKQNIYGYDYFLDQDFTDGDKKSLLKGPTNDILFKYKLPDDMTPVEAIHELFLRHNQIFHLKPSDISSQEFVEGMKVIWDKGVSFGKIDCARFWRGELSEYIDELEEFE